MKTSRIKEKVIFSALAGAVLIPGSAIRAYAADEAGQSASPLPAAGIEAALEECCETNVKDNLGLYLVPTEEGEYLNRAFSNVSDYTYIRSAPEEESDWTGKIYSDSTVTILEYDGDWTKIQSGNAVGYVPSGVLYTGKDAKAHEDEYEKTEATVLANVLNVRNGQGTEYEIVSQVCQNEICTVSGEPENGWYPVHVGDIDGWVSGEYIDVETSYSYGETREEEEVRLTQSQEILMTPENVFEQQPQAGSDSYTVPAAGMAAGTTGQAVIDFACQFIGNPYVWGGTSLTEGADCSGFVQSVYANFGISLPRTTWDMENVGYAVSLEEALPGDLVLYDGHVGLYMGDGNIVNAMNEVDGIGICSAEYAPILTIRRVL